MRLFSPDRIIKVMDRLGVEEGEVITHGMVTKAIEKAQVRVETQNYEIRKHLLQYDDVVNKQREVIYGLRRDALTGVDLQETAEDFLENAVGALMANHASKDDAPDFWDMEGLALAWQGLTLSPLPLKEKEHLEVGYEALDEKLVTAAREKFEAKRERLGPEITGQLLKFVLIQVLDEQWRDHLNELIMLRSGIGLRSYGQRDPLIEYKGESFRLFETLLENIERDSVRIFFRAELAPPPERAAPDVSGVQTQHSEVSAYDTTQAPASRPDSPVSAGGAPGGPRPVQREAPKVGRNDPCPCGSGRKYKKCCGVG